MERKPKEGSGQVSRRGFVQGVSTAVLSAGIVGLTGCSTSDEAPASQSSGASQGSAAGATNDLYALEPVGEPTETLTTDVVIIGGGGTGISASIQARQLGLETIVVEKMGSTGGAWICTEGMFAIDSHWQKEAGVTTTMEEAIEACMQFHHYIPSHSLYSTWIEKTAETIEWVEEQGANYTAVVPIGTSFTAFHVYEHGEDSVGAPGGLLMQTLADKSRELGTNFMLQTTARRLVIEDGKVAGIIVEKDDGTIAKIEAPVAIIATGGYGQNTEMLQTLTQSILEPHDLGVPGRDGDGIKMGVDVGAKLWDYMGTVLLCGPSVIGANWGTNTFCVSVQPTIWVNQDCERVVREDVFIESFAYAGQAVKGQDRILVLYTDEDITNLETTGAYGAVFTFVAEGTQMVGLREDLEKLRDAGSVYVGETIEELAKEANLDPDALTASLQRYNDMCDRGVDEDFGKAAKHMRPIKQGPFYALECQVGSFGTCGGLWVTNKMECVDADRNPIPGLYAGGNDASGLMGDTYDVNVAVGSMASWAVNSGRMAAINAAEYLK